MVSMWKVDQILQLFAPFDCLGCGLEGSLLCKVCQYNCVPPLSGVCYVCRNATLGVVCTTCLASKNLTTVDVATAYSGLAVQLIGRLKFSRTQAAAHIAALIMDRRLSSSLAGVVVHVPTATARVRQRGYDQAQLIAREFARARTLPYQPLLRRLGKTRQVGANRQERLKQLQNAYYCPWPHRVQGKSILLVDDVLTTGATIETAAQVLIKAGAAEVRAVTFAQKA
ncbi:MAG: hypothetical protein QG553_162 [Patescibacteria group bacterium]|nr:hypothetical protein [Patescibacteria group bacterium]